MEIIILIPVLLPLAYVGIKEAFSFESYKGKDLNSV